MLVFKKKAARNNQREDRIKKHIPVISSTACFVAVITSQNHDMELEKSDFKTCTTVTAAVTSFESFSIGLSA